ncbi:hypothetical protein AM571_PB00425 (plasmid) [Rhizobium etli 8C-3]|uniref:Uncharacterized protein n=1 Tax=Rhizobium etli 8C-3 TaxID=538025 RepID=A0A1L5PC56_RHIET|nr:hypothetical protein AM571_PB00425 [Rhizobium etli 8C-3]MVO97839.1 hypothetical protein [Rhizobium leguminosarum bv. phaseoli]
MYDLSNKKIWVVGHRSMVGSALVRRLRCRALRQWRQLAGRTRSADREPASAQKYGISR